MSPEPGASLLHYRLETKLGGWSEQWPDGFDVSGDGRRFVVAQNVDSGDVQPSIVVVQNWFAEFGK